MARSEGTSGDPASAFWPRPPRRCPSPRVSLRARLRRRNTRATQTRSMPPSPRPCRGGASRPAREMVLHIFFGKNTIGERWSGVVCRALVETRTHTPADFRRLLLLDSVARVELGGNQRNYDVDDFGVFFSPNLTGCSSDSTSRRLIILTASCTHTRARTRGRELFVNENRRLGAEREEEGAVAKTHARRESVRLPPHHKLFF